MLIGREGARQGIDFGMNLRHERPPVHLRDADSWKRSEFDRRLAGLRRGHQSIELQAFRQCAARRRRHPAFRQIRSGGSHRARRVDDGSLGKALAREGRPGSKGLEAEPGGTRKATVGEPLIVLRLSPRKRWCVFSDQPHSWARRSGPCAAGCDGRPERRACRRRPSQPRLECKRSARNRACD